MSGTNWVSDGVACVLREGPHDGERIGLKPSKHKTLTMSDGSQYFRMPNSRTFDREDGTFDVLYLWTDYWTVRLASAGDPQ